MTAWVLVNEVDFPASAEEKGSKKFVPMPSTWLNQERWNDEDVVCRLEQANSPEAKVRKIRVEIRQEIDRLGLNGIVPEEFRGTPNQVIVSQLGLDSASQYLAWLKQQPAPKALWRVDRAAA